MSRLGRWRGVSARARGGYLVGSSRNRASGTAASSMAMFTRFRCPPEMPLRSSSPIIEWLTPDRLRAWMIASTWLETSVDVQEEESRVRAEWRMFSRTVRLRIITSSVWRC